MIRSSGPQGTTAEKSKQATKIDKATGLVEQDIKASNK